VGDQAAFDGVQNTAIGAAALLSNSTGARNIANGALALFSNTTGNGNIAIGVEALYQNTEGINNVAIGYHALYSNTHLNNIAIGQFALQDTNGNGNVGVGNFALLTNVVGELNTAVGHNAGQFVTGSGNVCIGQGVGHSGVDDTTWIRNVNTLAQNFSAGVNDYVPVRLSDGRLGHTAVVSSRRYKEDIKPLAAVSEALYALNPVSFRLKKEYDETQRRSFGLIAEEVEKIDPDLVYYNNKGQAESVRYELINAMLLNEFLKEHRKNEEQGATIARLEKQLETVTATLQKVSAQLELNKPAPQTVLNNQ